MKTAFITGIGGQDGYFLSRFLSRKGYKVHGLVRSFAPKSMGTLLSLPKDEFGKITLVKGDITDVRLMSAYIKKNKFSEIYHLAGQTSIHPSLKDPNLAYRENIDSVMHLLGAIRQHSPKSRLFLAASSELFGDAPFGTPQNEKTPFFPRNPYGFSKLAAFWAVKYYRENYKVFACSGILYNHESELRGEQFVTRKISVGVAKIFAGKQKDIVLGDISAERDWGYAGDYVEAMWKMLQQKKADDFVIATGKLHSVRDFVQEAFKCVGIKLRWMKKGRVFIGQDSATRKILVRAVFSGILASGASSALVGDSAKAKKVLKWFPSVDFKTIVSLMVLNETNKYTT